MKRYTTLNQHYQARYQTRVFKVPLDAHLTCPNRDGTKGFGGCIYFSASGSNADPNHTHKSLYDQYWLHKARLHDKWPNAKTMPYFQSHTNTYAPLKTLKTLFETALELDPINTVGLSIATRPDALEDETVAYLGALNQRVPIQVELGLQSIHETSTRWMRRGHDLACFVDAVERLRAQAIEVVVHIINGLPNETEAMMLETVQFLNTLDIQGIKIHMLHITSDAPLGHLYLNHPWPLLTLEEYVNVTAKQLTHLKKDIVIHRLTGDGMRDVLIAPLWTLKKWEVLNALDAVLETNDWHQGMALTTTTR